MKGERRVKKKTNESSELVDLLRRAIITGELKPRERLVETALAEKYHVSRTPVREAIKHLEALGLVTLERYKGAVVADIDLGLIREMQIVRASLEGLAAALAADSLKDEDFLRLEAFQKEMEYAARSRDIRLFSEYNERFHDLIYEGSGNRFLLDTIRNLLKSSWHEPGTSWKGLGDVSLIMAGHKQILSGLRERDPDKARQAAERHILDAIRVHDLQRSGSGVGEIPDIFFFRAY